MLTKGRFSARQERARPWGLRLFRRARGGPLPLNLGYTDLPYGAGTANDAPEHATLGEALKAVREERGLTLDDVAETTRVRRAYLEAIEAMRLDVLPSRPFTIGYIRAYASALGLDPDSAVERFKAEEPVLDEPLPNPVGVPEEKDPRVAAFLIGAIVIIAAIMVWNIAQRAMMAGAPPPPRAADDLASRVLAQAKPMPIVLGKPLPAPVESTVPPPYETPGLAQAMGQAAGAPAAAPKPAEDTAAILATLPPTFTPAGPVYDAGNPRLNSGVVVQALKPALLIARGADGSVYFARQFAKGEAYRVPALAGLTLDVSNPHDFQVFVAGQSKGLLPAQQVLAAKLVTPEATAPAPAAAPPRPAAPAAPPPAAAPAR